MPASFDVSYLLASLMIEPILTPPTKVDWHDPNSVRQNNVTSCSCIYKWSWDGKTAGSGENNTYTESYSMCYEQLPVYFEMRIAAFNSSEDFALEMAHRYHDSEYVFPHVAFS